MVTASTDGWSRVANASLPYSVFNKPIQRSELDDRQYRLIRLDNGLQALLVHDPTADKAAASLDVSVGHLADPDDMPGLAHFCEHLLFMGTEKYPRENEYSEYLSANNGASNAYTSISNTNYYFSVANSALPGALARFAAFFHCPLFSPSCTTRELNAVDSEHQKNHQNDLWRIYQLNKHLSKPGHPWVKFGSGNKDSLSKAARDLKAKGKLTVKDAKDSSIAPSPIPSRMASPAPSVSSTNSEVEEDGGVVGRETRRRVVEWWTKEYSAERMNLCVVGQDSLDELTSLATSLFAPILNRGYDPRPMVNDHPFGKDEKGTLVSAQTVMSFHAVEISFPLEWQPPLWKLKPSSFIAHFVGHEGKGSLHSYLKNKGWITELSSGQQTLGKGFDMYKVTIRLTKDGFQNYREVILATFKYLSLLRSTPTPFPPYLLEEQVTMDGTRFRYKEKGRPDDYASALSAKMALPYPSELVLATPSLTFNWSEHEDPNAGERLVRQYLDSFTIENGRAVIMAKEGEFEPVADKTKWVNEPWYGTPYRVERFDEAFIAEANKPNDIAELYLPSPNEFIPKNLNVEKKTVDQALKRPHLVRQTALSSLWHKKDDQFWVPKAYVLIDLRSHHVTKSARTSVLTKLYADLVNDTLTEYSYDASLAGLEYRFSPATSGLFITMNGYNDKMPVLVQHVLDKARNLVVNAERLEVLKQEAKRSYENFFMYQSYQLSDYYGRYLMTQGGFTIEEKLAEVSTVTPEEVQQFIPKLLSEVHMRILVNGNIYKDEAIRMAEIAETGLGSHPSSSTQVHPIPSELNEKALVIPDGSNAIWSTKILNPNQPNSALTYYVKFGSTRDQKLRVISALLAQILKEPAFNILRTKEQLGYVVFCSGWSLPGGNEHGLRVLVQSEKSAEYCEGRVEAFFDTMKEVIQQMNSDAFEEHKTGLEKKWREKYKNLGEETSFFNSQIDNGHLDFLKKENDAGLLKDVTLDDVLSLFLTKVHQGSSSRAKLSVHMVSQKQRPQRVSAEAAEAFIATIRDAAPDVATTNWKEALGDEPVELIAFGTYWANLLSSSPDRQGILSKLPGFVAQYPVPGEGAEPERSDVQYITDMKAFRSSLPEAADSGPVVEWGDLPVSKF